jgi:hypothetical protein
MGREMNIQLAGPLSATGANIRFLQGVSTRITPRITSARPAIFMKVKLSPNKIEESIRVTPGIMKSA